ncbi:Cupredoxin [Halomonas aquamarina]|uniref:Cupredoxin n=2 Tax=Vreelandella aquamarina TaxID=77097 RepID=A0ACC5VSX6_9GAMM|nr:Cupredoxin [Halomonas aquamarina]
MLTLTALLISSPAQSDYVTVSSTDGQPLEDAVVEIYYEPSTSPMTTEVQSVYQRDATFHPHVTTIPTGSHVAFPNQDTTRHNVYSFSAAKTFSLNLYLQETPEPLLFDQPGIVVLGCNIHDQMQAFIVVSDAPFAAKTDASGMLALPTLPAGSHRMRVWHPRLDDSQQVWWEGEVVADTSPSIQLELKAVAPPKPPLSPLQQRFRDAG